MIGNNGLIPYSPPSMHNGGVGGVSPTWTMKKGVRCIPFFLLSFVNLWARLLYNVSMLYGIKAINQQELNLNKNLLLIFRTLPYSFISVLHLQQLSWQKLKVGYRLGMQIICLVSVVL